jgi:hypothetical protein
MIQFIQFKIILFFLTINYAKCFDQIKILFQKSKFYVFNFLLSLFLIIIGRNINFINNTILITIKYRYSIWLLYL